MKKLPFVTAMIVVRNEEKYIKECLYSLLQQSYPKDRYEVIVIDGCSNDMTVKIAHKIAADYKNGPIVRFLENEKKNLASGWNLGIKNAKGDLVVRIDAHGYADKDFIRKNVETIINIPDATCVGGSMETKSISKRGKLIADILSSPFGIGNSKFRYSKKAEYVDTVAFGMYRKEIFDQVGFFDETLQRNQDNDMHRRIRKAGGKFYLNPEIKSVYYARDTLKGMMKQGFKNGYWNIVTFMKDKESISIRHIIPLAFVLGIIGCLILGTFFRGFILLLAIVLCVYFALGIFFALKKSHKFIYIIMMPCMFFCLHICYGSGSLLSIICSPCSKQRRKK